jgi:hypothetical protein
MMFLVKGISETSLTDSLPSKPKTHLCREHLGRLDVAAAAVSGSAIPASKILTSQGKPMRLEILRVPTWKDRTAEGK